MRFRLHALLVVFSLTVAAVANADALKLRLTMPERMTDAPELAAAVTLENTSGGVLTVSQLDTASLRFVITPITDAGTDKFVVSMMGTPLRAPGRVLLLPGQAIRASQDVFRDYPLGLAPGTYTVRAAYDADGTDTTLWRGHLVSEPHALVIDAAATPEYRDFLRISGELRRGEHGAIAHFLDFAEAHPQFQFTPRLVHVMLGRLHGDSAVRAADFLLREYPDTEYAQAAAYTKDFAINAQRDRAEYERWMQFLHDEHMRPENADIARDVAGLGTILDARGFAAWQAFLEKHPDSYFSAEARWQLVNAAERGITPPGFTKEALLPRLYRALVTHDPESYWAHQAMRNPAVAAMVKGAQE